MKYPKYKRSQAEPLIAHERMPYSRLQTLAVVALSASPEMGTNSIKQFVWCFVQELPLAFVSSILRRVCSSKIGAFPCDFVFLAC